MHSLESGGLYPPIEFVIDAQSVFDALNVLDVCAPQESSLKLYLIGHSQQARTECDQEHLVVRYQGYARRRLDQGRNR